MHQPTGVLSRLTAPLDAPVANLSRIASAEQLRKSCDDELDPAVDTNGVRDVTSGTRSRCWALGSLWVGDRSSDVRLSVVEPRTAIAVCGYVRPCGGCRREHTGEERHEDLAHDGGVGPRHTARAARLLPRVLGVVRGRAVVGTPVAPCPQRVSAHWRQIRQVHRVACLAYRREHSRG